MCVCLFFKFETLRDEAQETGTDIRLLFMFMFVQSCILQIFVSEVGLSCQEKRKIAVRLSQHKRNDGLPIGGILVFEFFKVPSGKRNG